VVADDDWAWLNENELLEQYVPATLLFEGEAISQAAVRYKGFFGALRLCFVGGERSCDKLSLKLKFSEYDDSLRFHGLKRLNFHSMEGDPTKLHDMLGYGLFREAGVFAPRTTYAKLVVNGELLGLFAVVEQIDGSFTRSRFADGGRGNVYKEVWPVGTSDQMYLDALRTNREEEPSVEKMARFAADLAAAADDTFVPLLEEWTDFDALMNYLAVDRVIDNWDGIVAWYCVPEAFASVMGRSGCFNHNYYWYE
jgi:spore coat protein CotH